MKQVTRALRPDDLRHLLEHPPRASLAFVHGGQLEATPVAFRLVDGRYLIGVPIETGALPSKAKLLIDDGQWYFDLKGVWTRGEVARIEPPPGAGGGLDWYELTPEKSVAWHYGSMRFR